MFQSLLQRCRRALGVASNSSAPARRRPKRRRLALEGLEERAVLHSGGTGTGPVDLVVTGFTLDKIHNSDRFDPFLKATVTIVNNSSYRSAGFDVTFYAKVGAFEYAKGDLVLLNARSPRLDPGESITIERRIRDPVYSAPNDWFTNGYHIAVQADAHQRITETNDHNNGMAYNGADSIDLAADKAVILGVVAGLGFLTVNGAARQHLSHFLDGSGTAVNWNPGSFASNYLLEEPGFKKAVTRTTTFLEREIKKTVKATNTYFTSYALDQKVLGAPPILKESIDLFYAIRGTQGAHGSASGIQITSVTTIRGRKYYTFNADVSITFTDKYTFDIGDAGLRMGNYVRHLEMCGWAKKFDVSITAVQKVTGLFSI